jgi:hypothetical protein
MKPNRRSFTEDERAIEGLPIRLIIALVVGVAALGLMLQVLGTFGGFGDEEVTVQIGSNETVDLSDAQTKQGGNVSFTVVTEGGDPVEGATVLLEPGTAQGDIIEAEVDGNGEATVDLSQANPSLQSDQNRGTYVIDILPPSDGDYTDDQENPEIVLLDN